MSCDQELNHFILQNEDKLFQCSYPKPIHGVLGKNSLLVVVGDAHKRLRTMALTLVSTTKSKVSYLNDIEEMAVRIIHSWKNQHRTQILFCEEARKVRSKNIKITLFFFFFVFYNSHQITHVNLSLESSCVCSSHSVS